MPKTINPDPVIEEIHQIRQQMVEKFGGDIAAILEDARQRQLASGRMIWQGPSADAVILPGSDGTTC